MKKLMIAASAVALSLTSLPEPAMAKGPNGCPPGLAKKTPACVPPGQAKKGVSAQEWRRGDRIDEDRYDRLRRGDRVIFDGDDYLIEDRDGRLVLRRDNRDYDLPRIRDDRDYVQVGDQILSVSRETQEVIDVIRLADVLLRY